MCLRRMLECSVTGPTYLLSTVTRGREVIIMERYGGFYTPARDRVAMNPPYN